MSVKLINLTPALHNYLLNISLREADILKQLREETYQHVSFKMQISPEQGQLMALLIEMLGAVKTLDIGTFTGYSALVVALAMPDEGRVIACDVNTETTAIAKRFWIEAGVENKIALKIAPALETLQTLLDNGESDTFDFAFIDADKANYIHYYEKALALVRPGGLILVDNVLWDGKVADINNQDNDTNIIRTLNEKILKDERVSLSLIPIGDGLTIARKR